LTATLALGVTLLVGSAYLAAGVLWFGDVDPKWGSPWDNFLFGFQLLAIASVVEAVFLGAFVAMAARHFLAGIRPRLIVAITMAIATIVLWPPKASSPIVTAGLVAAVALFAGSVSVWLSQRTGTRGSERESAVTGA
jgi:hypothetical protein